MQGLPYVLSPILASTTAASEGALLVGTSSKTALGGTTTVEASLAALGTAAIKTFDTDGTMTANSSSRVPAQSAVVTYVGAFVSAGYQPLDATLTALSGANWAANSLAIGSGSDTVAQVTFAANTFPARASSGNLVAKSITDFGLSMLDDANAAALFVTLGASASATDGQILIGKTSDNSLNLATLTAGYMSSITNGAGAITLALASPLTVDADGATVTFNLAASNTHQVTLGGNRTLALSNAGSGGKKFLIELIEGGSGGHTVTWFSGITWKTVGAAEPTLDTSIGAVNVFGFLCTGSGTYIGWNLTPGEPFEIGVDVQAWDADLDAIAALTSAANTLPYATGAQAWALTSFTAAARTVLDDATVADMVNTLGGASSTGSNGLVRATSPTIATPVLTTPDINAGTADSLTSLSVRSTGAAFDLKFAATTVYTADKTLTFVTGDANRTFTLTGNLAMSGAFNLTLTVTADTNVTLPTTGTLATLAGTETLSSKRITRRVVTAADATSITANGDTSDVVYQANTQAVGTLTMNAPTGTPTDGQRLTFRIKSTNIQTYSWNSIFVASVGTALPTVSTGSTSTDVILFEYDTGLTKWVCLATA